MPSPFPGMDPYLEDPRTWPDLHHELISEIRAQLTGQLRPKYVARIEERVYISDDRDPGRKVIVPDIHVAPRNESQSIEPAVGAPEDSSVAVVEPIVRTTLIDDEIHEAYVTLFDVAQREIVAVIEVLSPTNKFPNSEGRKSYLQKRYEVMRSTTHFVEIDLLREGDRIPVEPGLPDCEYLMHVSRNGDRPQAKLWAVRLNQRLPELRIPLRPEDDDARLDLQAILNSVYDRAGYDLIAGYSRDPVPPLPPEWSEWARKLLTEKGLRK